MTLLSRSGLVLAALALVSCAPQPPKEAVPVSGQDSTAEVEAYRTWVLGQADRFLVETEAFAEAVKAGNREKARELYAPTRMPYERIEPIAEALGDLDPRIDAREGDVAEVDWRGFHKLEKILWSTTDMKEAAPVAETLVQDVRLLRAQVETAELSAPTMVTGAVELLNEVSTSKVTGEEERYSRTDLWDFQANVEGADQVWQILSPAIRTKDPELAKTLDARFSLLYGLLEVQKKNGVFRPYTDVYPKEIQALSKAVDALAEPLAQLGRYFPAE